jgi:type I restriction and modification enzyme subunit R-like protein
MPCWRLGRSEHPDRLPGLALSRPDLRTRGEGSEVFDPIRSLWVSLTPEEWVRQHVIRWLTHRVGVPPGLLSVERGIAGQADVRRTDVLAHDRLGKPWMLVECKAPSVVLAQQALDQVSRYAKSLHPPYMVITNGHKLFAAERESGGEYNFLPEIPLFPDSS